VNIFDIIGPVMIGPSSSHTSGAARIGRVARKILGEQAAVAKIGLTGSFARTHRGHGTDKAIVAGILDMKPDDERIPHSLEIAKQTGLSYSFSEIKLVRAHPNTAVVDLTGISGAGCTVQGASIGGGSILVSKLNGMDSVFSGEQDTLIITHKDSPGMIASVAALLAGSGINIGNFRLSRPHKGKPSIMTIELDEGIEKESVEGLRALPGIISVVYMRAAFS